MPLLAAVVGKPEAELESALDRLIGAGLLFRQGVPPHATYLFKHALVQDAAYGTLLREPRRALHARIAETLESQFTEIAENQPEILARHCTEAGLIEKAAGLWGKAGQRSLARSALVEAVAQLTRALDQLAALPGTPALRREQIEFQVALLTPLYHVKGYAAPETIAAAEKAQLLIHCRLLQVSRLLVHWQAHLPKRTRKQGVVRLYGALLVSFSSTTAKRAGGGPVPPSNRKKSFKASKNLSPRGATITQHETRESFCHGWHAAVAGRRLHLVGRSGQPTYLIPWRVLTIGRLD